MNAREIDLLLSRTPYEELHAACMTFKDDERTSVKNLVRKYEKKLENYRNELKRLDQMMIYERKYADLGLIAGIDEAGRGPLAGPVVAAAVILPKDHPILYVNDSKQLSEKKREALYDVIMKEAVSVGVGMASEKVIDEINILQATYRAMREAVSKLTPYPDVTLNDAVTIPELSLHQVPIIKGDAKSASIAAASIIAKVTRDRIMKEYDKLYPEYGFASHKGYGSQQHMEALRQYGPCTIHRMTFIEGILSHE